MNIMDNYSYNIRDKYGELDCPEEGQEVRFITRRNGEFMVSNPEIIEHAEWDWDVEGDGWVAWTASGLSYNSRRLHAWEVGGP